MDNVRDICVEEGTTITESIKRLDSMGNRLLLVTKSNVLTGIVTDGDIRRWILKKGDFETDVVELMNKNPKVLSRDSVKMAKQMMLDMRLEAIPIVDENNVPIDVIFLRDVVEENAIRYNKINIPVVIMAGGKGTRLYPYTNVLPKPLIPIGSTTILERIMQTFYRNGCNEFWLTLNYKKNLIKAYLNDKKMKYHVNYVEEEDFQGTCGSISLLKGKLSGSFFISNCDVLVDIDYSDLYDYHQKCKNELTVVTSLKHMQLPYGVLELNEGGTINSVLEKPTYNCNINTGIYVMEASVINDIPRNQVYHMTDLINKLVKEKRKIGAYPITEQCWKDMGEIEGMNKMIADFQN